MITVILTKDVEGCGRAGDVCEVSAGFARNGLFRTGSAVVATKQQIEQQKAQMARREAERAARHDQAERAHLTAGPLPPALCRPDRAAHVTRTSSPGRPGA